MARQYIEGQSSNDPGAPEFYRNVSVVPVRDVNAFVTSTADSVGPNGLPLTTRVDEPSATVTYVGKAEISSGSGSAVWQIYKMTISGTQLIITWADGDSSFNNIWDNRASLTYS